MCTCSEGLTRRQAMKNVAAMAAAFAASSAIPLGWARAATDTDKPRKVLFFTQSAGFQHDCIKRDNPDQLSFAEKVLVDLGKQHGFDVTATDLPHVPLEPVRTICEYRTCSGRRRSNRCSSAIRFQNPGPTASGFVLAKVVSSCRSSASVTLGSNVRLRSSKRSSSWLNDAASPLHWETSTDRPFARKRSRSRER